MAHDFSRRDVLKASGATALGLALSANAPSQVSRKASDRLRFAIVGVGGKGWSNMEEAARHGDIVALCDVDAETRSKGMMQFPRAATFSDYRRLFDAMHKEFDVVVVSTPDHNHAAAAALAMRAKKHVYCEKPLTRTIFEARRLAQLARENRVMTQMGNQGTANDNLRRAVAAIRSGIYGKAKDVHCWTDRAAGWWPQGVGRPEPKPAPRHVDWDVWLGPAPERPYADGYHPFAWRGRWDFGSGSLGDIGCHCMNLPFMALDLRDPLAVQSKTSGNNKETFPVWSVVTYEFGPRGDRPALNLTWYDGGQKPSPDLAPGVAYDGNGCLVILEKATLYFPGEYGGGTRIVGGGELPNVEYEKSPGHFTELVLAAQGGKAPRGHVPDYSGPLTETVLLGNLAVWADGRRVEWDARRLRAKGTDEFEPLIRPVYRTGWEL